MRVLRVLGIILGSVVVLIVVAIAVLYFLAGQRMGRQLEVATSPVSVPSDPASVERGRHLVAAVVQCAGCHGEGLGGSTMVDDGAFGRIVAPNLTTGAGGVGQMDDAAFERAIRHGVGHDGRPLIIMPSEMYASLSDADIGSIIAYIRSLPPRDSTQPATSLGPIARMLVATGQLPFAVDVIDHGASHASVGPTGPTTANTSPRSPASAATASISPVAPCPRIPTSSPRT